MFDNAHERLMRNVSEKIDEGSLKICAVNIGSGDTFALNRLIGLC